MLRRRGFGDGFARQHRRRDVDFARHRETSGRAPLRLPRETSILEGSLSIM
jgi:hypothetical protein